MLTPLRPGDVAMRRHDPSAALPREARLAGAILERAGLRAFRRMAAGAGPGHGPGRFHALCRAEVDALLRDLEDADPAAAAAVSALIDASGW